MVYVLWANDTNSRTILEDKAGISQKKLQKDGCQTLAACSTLCSSVSKEGSGQIRLSTRQAMVKE